MNGAPEPHASLQEQHNARAQLQVLQQMKRGRLGSRQPLRLTGTPTVGRMPCRTKCHLALLSWACYLCCVHAKQQGYSGKFWMRLGRSQSRV